MKKDNKFMLSWILIMLFLFLAGLYAVVSTYNTRNQDIIFLIGWYFILVGTIIGGIGFGICSYLYIRINTDASCAITEDMLENMGMDGLPKEDATPEAKAKIMENLGKGLKK